MRLADAIANWIHEKGITHAFTITGGGIVVLLDAIQKKGATAIVCCHHEQAAAMASAYFNRTRCSLSSVVLCTTGAGSTNAITGVMAAYMDSTPLLVLSGNENSKYMNANTRVWGVQGYGSAEVANPFCKYALRMGLDFGLNYLSAAYQLAIRHRQGPAWVDICKDVQNATI